MEPDTAATALVMSRDIVDKPASQLLFVLGCRFLRSDELFKDSSFRAAAPSRLNEHLRLAAGPHPSQTLKGALGAAWPRFVSMPPGCSIDDVQL